MKAKSSSHISIAEQIIEGSITISSVNEFASILKIFPNDAALHKAYSDLLLKKKHPKKAAQSYDRAARLFIDAGKLLQALDSKLLQWKIKPPSTQEIRFFYSALQAGSFYETPSMAFFHRLSFPEMVAIISKLVRGKLSPGKTVKNIGDAENNLYFVVSGKLKETVFLPLRKRGNALYRKRASFLTENQYFGDIHPFEEQKKSTSYIETIALTELIRITKSNLRAICKKHPGVEQGLIDLYSASQESADGDNLPKVRQIGRHQLPLKINLHIFMNGNKNEPLILDAYSRDVSVGGLCVILDGKYKSISSIYKNINTAKIELSLPHEELALKVAGDIVWSREFSWKKRKIVALGFQFKEMSPKFRGMFFMMADSICHTKG